MKPKIVTIGAYGFDKESFFQALCQISDTRFTCSLVGAVGSERREMLPTAFWLVLIKPGASC
jgi:hypothetical protein